MYSYDLYGEVESLCECVHGVPTSTIPAPYNDGRPPPGLKIPPSACSRIQLKTFQGGGEMNANSKQQPLSQENRSSLIPGKQASRQIASGLTDI